MDFDTSANLNIPISFYAVYGSLRFTRLSKAISFNIPEYFSHPKDMETLCFLMSSPVNEGIKCMVQ